MQTSAHSRFPTMRQLTAMLHFGKSTVTDLTRALILAVSVCYHARLSERAQYEIGIVTQFRAPLALPGGVQQFRNEIRW